MKIECGPWEPNHLSPEDGGKHCRFDADGVTGTLYRYYTMGGWGTLLFDDDGECTIRFYQYFGKREHLIEYLMPLRQTGIVIMNELPEELRNGRVTEPHHGIIMVMDH